MRIKKAAALILAVISAASVNVYAEDSVETYDETVYDETVHDEEDVKEAILNDIENTDPDLARKWRKFANKYKYDFKTFGEEYSRVSEMYPGMYLAISIGMNDDGTAGGVMIGHFSDAMAPLTGSDISMHKAAVLVNGSEEYPAVIFRNRTLVDASVFEKAGCEVVTDGETRVTSISRNGATVELMPYLLEMRKNGEEGFWFPVEICARYIGENNNVYVPLRAIANELGLTVDWDNEKRTASLNAE